MALSGIGWISLAPEVAETWQQRVSYRSTERAAPGAWTKKARAQTISALHIAEYLRVSKPTESFGRRADLQFGALAASQIAWWIGRDHRSALA